MDEIAARHYTTDPIICVSCLEAVQYKQPPPTPDTTHEPKAQIYDAVPGGEKGAVQTLYLAPVTSRRLRPKVYNRQKRRARRKEVKKLAKAPDVPQPSSYRGARFYLPQNCDCFIPVCVECSETFRTNDVSALTPRFYEPGKSFHCGGCGITAWWGAKSRSFIKGPDRRRYLELMLWKQANIPCRSVFGRPASEDPYCPYGIECKYSHYDPQTNQYVQQHQPAARRRADVPVRMVRRVNPDDLRHQPLLIDLTGPDPAGPSGPPPAIPIAFALPWLGRRPGQARAPHPRSRPATRPPPILIPAGMESDSEEDWSQDAPGIDVLGAIRQNTIARVQRALLNPSETFISRTFPNPHTHPPAAD